MYLHVKIVSFLCLFHRRDRKNCEKLLLASSYLSDRLTSVRVDQLGLQERIFMKYDVRVFFENL